MYAFCSDKYTEDSQVTRINIPEGTMFLNKSLLFWILIPASTFYLSCLSLVMAGWVDHEPVPVNSRSNPGFVDPHSNSGGRRIVRIDNTTIVICPHQQGERTYRSVDNGSSWKEIDRVAGVFSGCLVAGPERMVYHFYMVGDNIYMVKFRYNELPYAHTLIYTHPNLSESATGVYRAVNAIVDAKGVLFVAAHWGNPDIIYLFRSFDGGYTWDGPHEVSSGTGPWYYPHLELTSENILICTYSRFGVARNHVFFANSGNQGLTWKHVLISHDQTYNPSLLPVRKDRLFVFAQSREPSRKGLVYNRSDDKGATWKGWSLIDSTCGYADPSPALGDDGKTIYVAYRSSNGTGVTFGTCGNRSRSRLAMSSDFGKSWTFPDRYYEGERTGTRSQLRYQTWWNYGGPLEWIWLQYEKGGGHRVVYYEINMDVEICDIQAFNKRGH